MKSHFAGLLTTLLCVTTGLLAQTPQSFPMFQSLKQISSPGGGFMAGLNDKGEIFAWTGVSWVKVDGRFAQISAGSKTAIWGVNAAHDVYRLASNGWVKVPGPMLQVAVSKGGAEVVGINLQGVPQYRKDDAWVSYPNAPTLTRIGIGRPGKVYGLTAAGVLYKWKPKTSTWTTLTGNFRNLSIGEDGSIAVVNSQNIGFVRTDADVDAEVSGASTTPEWNMIEAKVEGVEILDINTSILLDQQGLLIQRESLAPIAGSPIVIDSALVVEELYEPAPALTFNTGQSYYPRTCAPGSNYKDYIGSYSPEGACVKPPSTGSGTFKKIKVKDRAVQQVQNGTTPGVTPGYLATLLQLNLGKGTSTAYVAQSTNAQTASGSIACPALHVRDQSAHSWAEFRLPDGIPAQVIAIPSGAYNNYVFPACNRVWWDSLIFVCDAKTGWKLASGRYDADAFCHGSTPQSPYLQVGNR